VPTVRVSVSSQQSEYSIVIEPGALERVGAITRRSVSRNARRVALVSNRTVFDLYGDAVVGSLKSHGFEVLVFLMGDGERFKNLKTLSSALDFLTTQKLERSDAVLALGGGVVGDMAGFAAAIYMRGISLIQVPTTLLSQIDSSVGGKTGVNVPSGKNLVGAFHQPSTVVIDPLTLRTLPERELTAGWCEAVKHGAVGDRELFDATVSFLKSKQKSQETLARKLSKLIAAQCAFKASIVTNDPRESADRSDSRSRKILNFGHTIGHALEAATRYKRFRHGEAVGYGMLAAGEISKGLGLLEPDGLKLLSAAVHACGPLPTTRNISIPDVIQLIDLDKKSSGGEIKWILLEGIGHAKIVSGKSIPKDLLLASLQHALQQKL
jgi:3-dehydroquinate synthase